jgi:hypothetical protein
MPRLQGATTPATEVPFMEYGMPAEGIPYCYDAVRGKWLSYEAATLAWSYVGTLSADTYLRCAGYVQSSVASYRMPHDGTIVWASVDSAGVITFSIKIYADAAPVYTLQVTAPNNGAHDFAVSVDFNAGQIISAQADFKADDILSPVVLIGVKWRVAKT